MKALEVLKKASVFSEHSKHYPSSRDFDEAIAELEALESRSCEDCKYFDIDKDDYPCKDCKETYEYMWEAKNDTNL